MYKWIKSKFVDIFFIKCWNPPIFDWELFIGAIVSISVLLISIALFVFVWWVIVF